MLHPEPNDAADAITRLHCGPMTFEVRRYNAKQQQQRSSERKTARLLVENARRMAKEKRSVERRRAP